MERTLSPYLTENTLQVHAIAPENFHLLGRVMDRFLYRVTEAAGMEDFTIPFSIDPSNSETSPFSAKHPLGGRKRARDDNGFMGWRDSWVSACIYNGTRGSEGVQITVTAHACADIPTEKILRAIYTAIHPHQMEWGMLSSTEGVTPFRDYEVAGDEHFKTIVNLLWANPRSRNKKVELGQLLEREVLARKELEKHTPLDKLLLKHELRKLQRIFGDYEGILEQETATQIIDGAGIDSFPYLNRYNELTDSEIRETAMTENIRSVCMIGGGWLPISAILYAMKTDAHIYVVEKDPIRIQTAENVVKSLGLEDRITFINQKAEDVDYSNMDIVIFAAMAQPKHKILQRVSETDFPRTIAIRGPLGDSRAIYPSFTPEDLFGRLTARIHHIPDRHNIKPESDGIFAILYLDSERVAYLP